MHMFSAFVRHQSIKSQNLYNALNIVKLNHLVYVLSRNKTMSEPGNRGVRPEVIYDMKTSMSSTALNGESTFHEDARPRLQHGSRGLHHGTR